MSDKQRKPKLIYRPGLRNVITGETRICLLDEKIKPPMFFYYGYSIADLARHSNFEEVAYLLLHGELPTKTQFEQFKQELITELKNLRDSQQGFDLTRIYLATELHPHGSHPMGILRSLVSIFGENDLKYRPGDDDLKRAKRLIAVMPFLVANIGCYEQHRYPCFKEIFDSQAKNFLYFWHSPTPNNQEPNEFDVRIFDVASILYAEHEFNVSTTTLHAITSANSDIYSAVCGAIGALKGNLHGGANEAAMKLLLEIGSVDRTEDVLKEKTAKAEKIMGFGHAVYKQGDPRCPIMKPLVRQLCESRGVMKWFEMSEKIEKVMLKIKKGKRFYPNIDFWTAPAYYLLGIPIELYTPIFAMARVAGWGAHFMEYKNLKHPLMRPRAKYIGSAPRPYIPIEQRS